MYQQTRPDFIDGFLLALPQKTLPKHLKVTPPLYTPQTPQGNTTLHSPNTEELKVFITTFLSPIDSLTIF
jgi:hypothetical protein